MSNAQQLLLEGSSDAVGFVGGALLGWGVSHVLGLDLFAQGYGAGSIAAIALVGLGGGLGLKLARLWRKRKTV
ncbi:hypothetical protein [Comamonas suwonensis]|uniref:hypothetical protein n=1 Tax=Comamonas suwonensis TaxID=2606214 RepID=UPI00145EC617|nr:hypothetical protein [Comamonas suwonensis]MBI1623979.1 hypothetical protein [Comamonas suwonensis]